MAYMPNTFDVPWCLIVCERVRFLCGWTRCSGLIYCWLSIRSKSNDLWRQTVHRTKRTYIYLVDVSPWPTHVHVAGPTVEGDKLIEEFSPPPLPLPDSLSALRPP